MLMLGGNQVGFQQGRGMIVGGKKEEIPKAPLTMADFKQTFKQTFKLRGPASLPSPGLPAVPGHSSIWQAPRLAKVNYGLRRFYKMLISPQPLAQSHWRETVT